MAAWDKTKCAEGILCPDLNDEIRENNEALEAALTKEHHFSTGGAESLQGLLKQGSARCFCQATQPNTRIDGSAFAETDNGSIWVHSGNNKIYTLTDYSGPTWTLISTEIIATLLAAARVFAGTLGVTGNFAVNTNKFTVAAESGNTAVAGTLGVTGIATLGDNSKLATSGAPAADAQIAPKKYVDDKVAAEALDPDPMTGSNNSSGTCKFPNGLILAWGASTVPGNDTVTVAHGLTKCFRAFVQASSDNTNDLFAFHVHSIGDTNFTVRSTGSYGGAFNWLAVGR